MNIFKNFKLYEPSNPLPELVELGVKFICSDDGTDWYDARLTFKSETLKIMFNADGLIVAESYDIYDLWPLNLSITEIESTESCVEKYFDIKTSKVIEKTVDPIAVINSQIAKLRREVQVMITPLQYAVDLDEITDDELQYLNELKKYVIKISKISEQKGYPDKIVWPKLPTKI